MSLPTRCMPVLMLGPNDRLGRPRVEELRDFIGMVGAGVEGDSATRFRALLRRHSIAVRQRFHLATPTFYGSSGRSRIDFVATHPSVQFSRIFVNFTADRRLQLILAAGPRDQLAMDLVTSGMRHCPDLTRGRWDHEKSKKCSGIPLQGSLFSRNSRQKFATRRSWDVQRLATVCSHSSTVPFSNKLFSKTSSAKSVTPQERSSSSYGLRPKMPPFFLVTEACHVSIAPCQSLAVLVESRHQYFSIQRTKSVCHVQTFVNK